VERTVLLKQIFIVR